MSKLLKDLEKQIQYEEYRKDGEDCIEIYNKLLELTGNVWQSVWSVMTQVDFTGKYPNSYRIYKPSIIGKYFLTGCRAV